MAKEVKNEKILKAAEKVYQTSGLEKTTVTDICDVADISRKTFYQRYKNIDELLTALIEFISRKIVSKVEKAEKSETGYLNMLWEIFDAYSEIANVHPVLSSIYRSRYSRWVDWNESSFVDKFDKTVHNKIEEIISGGQKSGEIKTVIDADHSAYLITSVLGLLFFMHSSAEEGNVPAEKLIDSFRKILELSLQTKTGKPRISIE
jgi:AcrR family transcriptional regulator